MDESKTAEVVEPQASAVEKRVEPAKPDIMGCDYHIAFLFQCPHCKHQQAIVDPKLVVVGLHGQPVRLACLGCHNEVLAQPANRIVGAQVGVQPTANRHERRKQRAIGLVGPNGKPVV